MFVLLLHHHQPCHTSLLLLLLGLFFGFGWNTLRLESVFRKFERLSSLPFLILWLSLILTNRIRQWPTFPSPLTSLLYMVITQPLIRHRYSLSDSHMSPEIFYFYFLNNIFLFTILPKQNIGFNALFFFNYLFNKNHCFHKQFSIPIFSPLILNIYIYK